MASYTWPKQGATSVVGKSADRFDGVAKASGTAKYSYDINTPNMLVARLLGSPHAHAKIKSIDTAAAKAVPGVKVVMTGEDFEAKKITVLKKAGAEVKYQGDLIAVVAAESEAAATEGVKAIKVEYEMLDVFVKDEDLDGAKAANRVQKGGKDVKTVKEPGDNDDEDAFIEKELARLYNESPVKIEGKYGIEAITHMCLEPHGSTCEWQDGKLLAHLSTQNVSGTGTQFSTPLGIGATDVTVHCDYIGGGFGSKFQADEWGVIAAYISREQGRGVKLMLDRDQELKIAGCRPSGYVSVKVGADDKGVVQVWDSHHWGTSGPAAGGNIKEDIIPYVFKPANRRSVLMPVLTNAGPQRAWRAPGHPQACAISQVVYDDIAAKLGIDSYDVFLRNLPTVAPKKKDPATGADISLADTYADQMRVAAQLIDWKAKWHPHGKGPKQGSIVTGLGMALHTWGGAGHNSTCLLRIHPDGAVESSLASQDLGTGTRTAIAMVVAETFGLPATAVKVNMGSSKYTPSGPSGGSTTIGGVSESNRRAALDALEKILALVAGKLGVDAGSLEAKGGRIQVAAQPNNGMSWKDACGLLGNMPLEVKGEYVKNSKDPKTGADSKLSGVQVGGVQMAEVAVDRETGVVKMKKFVAVQDMGLIINRKAAASQIYGAVIMGIAFALFEERVMDGKSGAFLNCEIADYKLPRLGDIGEIVVELYEPETEYNRGVIGLGEPPVISPGAAISNAVANALGVRVPSLPLTPKRVLDALAKAKV